MSEDGAYQGVGAERALGTILGGEPQPTDEEKESIEQMRERILAAPIEARSYDGSATACARIILEAYQAEPELVNWPTEPIYQKDSKGELVFDEEGSLVVVQKGLYDVLRSRFADDSPEVAVFQGLTGFMWGWAVNAARRCVEADPKPNPALLTINLPAKEKP